MNNLPKLNRWVIIGLLAAIVIVALVIFFTRSGRGELLKASQSLSKAETMHTKVQLTLHLPLQLRGRERPFTLLTMRTEGDVKYNEKIPEYTGSLSIEAKGRGNIFFADGEWRLLKDQVLFRLENLPVFINPTGSLIKKWTTVAVPTLSTTKPEETKQAIQAVLGKLQYQGKKSLDGVSTAYFKGTITAQEEDQLAQLLDLQHSGNRSLHMLARLLRGGNIQSIEAWVNKSTSEIPRLRLNFVRPVADNKTIDFATLDLSFTEYGKKVSIDVPKGQVTVKPEVFGRILGTGQIEAQQ